MNNRKVTRVSDQLRYGFFPSIYATKKIDIDAMNNSFNTICFAELPIQKNSSLSTLSVAYSRMIGGADNNEAKRISKIAMQYLQNPEQKNPNDAISFYSPFVQTVLYYGEYGKITEKADCDLEQFLKKQPKENLDIREMFTQILLGISDLHHRKLVHRDVKLCNVLVYDRNHCKLADLDMITRADNENAGLCGTPDHMPREYSWDLDNIEASKEYYKTDNKMRLDFYAASVAFYEVYSMMRNSLSPETQFLIDTLIPLMRRKGVTIERIMSHKFFGRTQKERADYFAQVRNKFLEKDPIYGMLRQMKEKSYPKENDAIFILPKELQQAYLLTQKIEFGLEASVLPMDMLKVWSDLLLEELLNYNKKYSDANKRKIEQQVRARAMLIHHIVEPSDKSEITKCKLYSAVRKAVIEYKESQSWYTGIFFGGEDFAQTENFLRTIYNATMEKPDYSFYDVYKKLTDFLNDDSCLIPFKKLLKKRLEQALGYSMDNDVYIKAEKPEGVRWYGM